MIQYSIKEILSIIQKIAIQENVNPDLAMAIGGVESNYHAYRTRFEPEWKYFLKPETYASRLGISFETEKVLQAMSWGPMQIMGSVCRELSYTDHLVCLADPYLSTAFACRKLNSIQKKYTNESDAISAYNAGTPRRDKQGLYLNAKYVDHVKERLNKLRLI
jgi:soluble lytic murein transglycosylase-like protein